MKNGLFDIGIEVVNTIVMLGMILSLCIIGYFMTVMPFIAGGPNGD